MAPPLELGHVVHAATAIEFGQLPRCGAMHAVSCDAVLGLAVPRKTQQNGDMMGFDGNPRLINPLFINMGDIAFK